ncbi:MAG TPA: sulfotransferase [Steroidobacteraceae bacterium]|nr:sulfotransferase [Steroidobacteraceae bacterium]
MATAAEPVGTLEVALAHASRLLAARPAVAAEQAREILKVVPRQPQAMLILGLACAAAGDIDGSIDALTRAVSLRTDLPDAWLALADQLRARGDAEAADRAYAHYIKAATRDPRLMGAAAALCENRIPEAEALLRAHLAERPNDVAALRMLAEVAARLLRYSDAQRLLERCLELAPSFDAARHNYATVLNRQGRSAEALEQCARLLAKEPHNPNYRSLQAATSANLGDFADSIAAYETVLSQYPQQPRLWMSYGHALRTTGRRTECIAAYRRALSVEPTLGEVWWSLANLKTFRFGDADLAAMREALARADLSEDDRTHFEFALGKALEDAASYADSFAHYAAGNALRRSQYGYDPEEMSRFVRRSKRLLTREFFAERAGAGASARDPIFIVGLPRAGSTLIEQILGSHPLVEGTMELPQLPLIARRLAGRKQEEEGAFLKRLATLHPDELRALGEGYLAETRVMRKTEAPFFIDKMPNNFMYVGLIHLILPNATIIDARRHPLGCGFSCFKQNFARGQWFSYGLEDLGRYYRDYVELMAHVDEVLPGKVTRVFYENVVEDTASEVRRLLEACGLPFEPRCLRFHENARAVRTPSSEQVRQPIFRDGVEQWRHYAPWLGPLERALGDVLTDYPRVPAFEPAGADLCREIDNSSTGSQP